MRVCILCIEMFGTAAGTYGGFGRTTRFLAQELAKRGVDVTVVVPQKRFGQKSGDYELDGFQVRQFPARDLAKARELYRSCDADVYHSQDPMLGTFLAQREMPHKAHMITFRDPMDWKDLMVEFRLAEPPRHRALKAYLFVDNPLVRHAIKRADALNCPAKFLVNKVRRMFRVKSTPRFLPSPYTMPSAVTKATKPTVCFVARLNPRKRPERFFELASRFPEVDFIAVGAARDADQDREIRERWAHLPNLEMTGAIDQFESDRLADIFSRSWVLVNPAAREGLPATFIEAAANRCAILSYCDPDGFASNFGVRSTNGDLTEGLSLLLENDRWRESGERGFEYVRNEYSLEVSVQKHLAAYEEIRK